MNILFVVSNFACGEYKSLSFVLGKQKIFFCVCGIVFGLAYLLVGIFERQKYALVSTVIATAFFSFVEILSFFHILISDEFFYLLLTCTFGRAR